MQVDLNSNKILMKKDINLNDIDYADDDFEDESP